mgnify:FL=1|jgi:hypothetical protein
MKKIKHLMIWIGLLLSLVSCKDTMEAIGLGGDEIPAEGLVLNIDLPNFSEKQLGTRADATESINSLTAVFYGEGNTYIGMAKDPELTQKETGKYQVTISNIPAGTTTVHLVTNVNDLSEKEASDLQDIAKATSRTIDTSSPVCWGSISVKSLLEGNATVSLLRQYAKVTLKVADAVKGVFPEENAGLIIKHTAAKSAIAPVGYSDPTSNPTYALPATTEYSSTEVGDGTSREVAVTETPAGEANIIIKASYNGKDGFKDGFYKVALYKDDKKNSEYALLRNHNYTITITKVNDYGFSSLDEAINSKPENRIEAQIVDDNPAITKMIACKDYELGVSDDLSVKATAAVATEAIKATITLVTTLSSATSADGKLYGVSINPADSWITFDKDKDVTETKLPESENNSSPGMKYVLTFTLDKNDKSEDPRKGTVTITSGDLKLDVKITQAGFDFRRDDPKRKVTMLIDNTINTENYFEWLDKNMQGIRPEQMLGNVRNNGFHFAVGKNTYSYKIPYLEDDKLTDTDDHFKVEKDGNFWKVTLTDNRDDNYDLWQGSFTITNKEGIKITYYVYHTGIFHKITDEMAKKYELAEGGDDTLKVKGWFYYGVVKVEGNAHTYIMLDRNLGATDNSPYAPDVNELKDHKGAIGGYFKISENKTSDAKKGNLSSTLSPEYFEIPEKSVFEDLIAKGTLKTEVRHTALGESYYCTFMNTTSSELKTIYLPYGGYLEGESHKYPMHVVFWTKTLVSGTQGFSEKSPEYGYWYNYFDVYNDKKGFSNVRFVSGSNGNNTGRYKAMPLRLVRVLK